MPDGHRLGGPSDDQIEEILAGRGGEDDAALTAFVGQVREAYLEPPAEDARKRHLAAMAALQEERSGAPDESSRARRWEALRRRSREPGGIGFRQARRGPERTAGLARGRLAAALACAVLALPLGTAGLAMAGVVLPEAVRTPFDELGITLPNQSSAEDVRAVIESTPPSDRGCAFGRAVAKAAGGAASVARPCPPPTDRGGPAPGRGPAGLESGRAPRAGAGSAGRSSSPRAVEPGVVGTAPPAAGAAGPGGAAAAGDRGGSPAEGRAREGTDSKPADAGAGSGSAEGGGVSGDRSGGRAEQGPSNPVPERSTREERAPTPGASFERQSSSDSLPGRQEAGERP